MGLASFNRMRREQAAKLALTQDGAGVEAQAEAPELNAEAARIAKGPGGKFYIKTGKKKQAGPFQTEAEAQAALDEANSVTPDGTPTPVPDEWEAMTDDELLALAEALSGGPVTASGEESPVDRAKSTIRATVDDRASRAGGA